MAGPRFATIPDCPIRSSTDAACLREQGHRGNCSWPSSGIALPMVDAMRAAGHDPSYSPPHRAVVCSRCPFAIDDTIAEDLDERFDPGQMLPCLSVGIV